MPSTLSTGFGQTGILANSPNNYDTVQPGQYRLTNVTLTPGIPVFSTEEIYKLSNGAGTPDISVKFQSMIGHAAGAIVINVYAI